MSDYTIKDGQNILILFHSSGNDSVETITKDVLVNGVVKKMFFKNILEYISILLHIANISAFHGSIFQLFYPMYTLNTHVHHPVHAKIVLITYTKENA